MCTIRLWSQTVFPIREQRQQNALAGQIQFLNIVEVNTPRGFLVQKPAHGFMYLCEQISRIDRGTINFAQVSVTSVRKAVNQPGIGILACAALSENQDGDICLSNLGGHGIEGEHGRRNSVDKPLGCQAVCNAHFDLALGGDSLAPHKRDTTGNFQKNKTHLVFRKVQVRFQKGQSIQGRWHNAT